MKKVLSLLIALALVLTTAAVAMAESADSATTVSADKQMTIYFMPKEISGAWNIYSITGATDFGKKMGVNVVVSGPASADATAQINMLEDAIVAKPDAIVIATNDAAGCVAPINEAIAQGITVITYDSDCAGSNRAYYVNSCSDYQCARDFVAEVAAAKGEDAKIAVMGGGISAGNQQDRLKGVQDEIAENYPNMQIVATTWSDDDAEVAFQNAENLIMANPDLDAIIGISGYEPHSAAAAVEEAVKEGIVTQSQIYVTGLTLPDVIRQYVEDGTVVSAYVTEPAYLAYTATYVAYELASGTTFKAGDKITIEGLEDVTATVNDDNTIYFGLIQLTKDNIDKYSW